MKQILSLVFIGFLAICTSCSADDEIINAPHSNDANSTNFIITSNIRSVNEAINIGEQAAALYSKNSRNLTQIDTLVLMFTKVQIIIFIISNIS